MEKILSDYELLFIEQFAIKEENLKLQIEKLKLVEQGNNVFAQLKEKEIEITKYKSELISIELKSLKEKGEKNREKKREFMLSLKVKHELPDHWGFNPESGEIILTESKES